MYMCLYARRLMKKIWRKLPINSKRWKFPSRDVLICKSVYDEEDEEARKNESWSKSTCLRQGIRVKVVVQLALKRRSNWTKYNKKLSILSLDRLVMCLWVNYGFSPATAYQETVAYN
jgi:hypothetical protein